MTGSFTSSITYLWARLNLGVPKFQPTGEVVLSLGGVDIKLKDTSDERHILLTGIAGRLAGDPRAGAEQVRSLLRNGLGFLTLSRACISLMEDGQGGLTVVVQAIYPYDDQFDVLVKIIHELLIVFECVRAELTARAPSIHQASLRKAASDNIIFLP